MKNKITYEMEDIMLLLGRDLAAKDVSPDESTMEIRARLNDGTFVVVGALEIDVNVTWSGRAAEPISAAVTTTDHAPEPLRDLLDEAPSPKGRPTITFGDLANSPEPGEISINDVTAASRQIKDGGGEGPFSKTRVKRRLSSDVSMEESTEYPGNPERRR